MNGPRNKNPKIYRGFSPAERRRIGRRRYPYKILISTVLVIIGSKAWLSNHPEPIESKQVPSSQTQSKPAPQTESEHKVLANQPENSDSLTELKQTVQNILDDNPDLLLAVAFKDLKSNQRFDLNGDQTFVAASTTKLITACLFLKEVENGSQSLPANIGSYPAQYQLEQLVRYSNNDSWSLLNGQLSDNARQAYATNIGLSSYQEKANTLNANDYALLLEKLYQGELLSQDHTKLLLSYMQDTNEENYIPAALPKTSQVYHKTGTLEDTVHDGAIVKNNNHLYVLVIFSNGKGFLDYDYRAAVFRKIIEAVDRQYQ